MILRFVQILIISRAFRRVKLFPNFTRHHLITHTKKFTTINASNSLFYPIEGEKGKKSTNNSITAVISFSWYF